jgi:bifunctional non-homologous end joining protein LigD
MRITSDSGARNAATTAPTVFVAFDMLWSDGRPMTSLPWELRRRQFDDLRLDCPGWRTSPILGLEEAYELLARGGPAASAGLVAKRLSSVYDVGASTPEWIRST